MDKKRKRLTTTQLVVLSFAAAIFVGAVLLTMPFSAADGHMTPFIDALYV